MVSQPQHPEFRNNPKNFQPCIFDLNTTNIHTTCFVCVDALHPSQQVKFSTMLGQFPVFLG